MITGPHSCLHLIPHLFTRMDVASEGVNGHEQQRVCLLGFPWENWAVVEISPWGANPGITLSVQVDLCVGAMSMGELVFVLPSSAHKSGSLALREACEPCQPHHGWLERSPHHSACLTQTTTQGKALIQLLLFVGVPTGMSQRAGKRGWDGLIPVRWTEA